SYTPVNEKALSWQPGSDYLWMLPAENAAVVQRINTVPPQGSQVIPAPQNINHGITAASLTPRQVVADASSGVWVVIYDGSKDRLSHIPADGTSGNLQNIVKTDCIDVIDAMGCDSQGNLWFGGHINADDYSKRAFRVNASKGPVVGSIRLGEIDLEI